VLGSCWFSGLEIPIELSGMLNWLMRTHSITVVLFVRAQLIQ
jgi:hypothetical protein